MKVCVIGIGYIGLPTACIIADKGFDVVGVDINMMYIDNIKKNKFKSKEKNLIEIIKKSLENKKLILQSEPEQADVFILCTPTPLDNNNNPDLSYLTNALYSIIPYLRKQNMVIIESTIPPKTTNDFIQPIIESYGFKIGVDIFLAHCPERVIPGNIIYELSYNNRIIGGSTKKCGEIIAKFYKEFVNGEIIVSSSEVAEMVKLVENSYRDVNIAFSNEISMICNDLSIDPYEVIFLANKHPRVNLLNPGIGVGGHCLPVDPYFIIEKAPNFAKLIETGRSINNKIPQYIVSKIKKILEFTNAPKIGIWGIAYKGNSDDIRKSPAIEIVNLLKKEDYTISIYDPLVEGFSSPQCKYESISNVDLLLVLVDHDEFKEENYLSIIELMKYPRIFDGTNIIDKSKMSDDISLYTLGNI